MIAFKLVKILLDITHLASKGCRLKLFVHMNLGNGFMFRDRPEGRDNLVRILACLHRHPVWLDQVMETLKLLVYIYKMKRNWCREGCIFNMWVLKVHQLIFAMCFETSVVRCCARCFVDGWLWIVSD